MAGEGVGGLCGKALVGMSSALVVGEVDYMQPPSLSSNHIE